MLLEDITINSDLLFLGKFSASAKMKDSVKGVLCYQQGKAKIGLFDYIHNEMQGKPIYGEFCDFDGRKIFAKFENIHSTNLIKGAKNTLFSTKMTVSNVDFNKKMTINYIKLNSPEISKLSESIIASPITPIINNSIIDDEDMHSYLYIEFNSDVRNPLKVIERNGIGFYTDFKKKFDGQKYSKACIDFLNLASLLYGNSVSIASIVYGSSNNKRICLDLNLVKNYKRQSHLYLGWEKFIPNLSTMFAQISLPRMHKLVNNFCLSINGTLEPEIEILNYTNAIENYMKEETYPSNGKKVKDLYEKLKRIIDSVNKNGIFFKNKFEEGNFCNSIKATRDYLVHGDKANNEELLRGDKLNRYDDCLKRILYYFILIKLGVKKKDDLRGYAEQLNYHLRDW